MDRDLPNNLSTHQSPGRTHNVDVRRACPNSISTHRSAGRTYTRRLMSRSRAGYRWPLRDAAYMHVCVYIYM